MPPLISSGTKLGRYEIRSQLGAGGMGEVYLAQDTSELERSVAIKLLPAEVASDAKRLQRFILEAKTVSALNHPNILTIYEFGQEGATRFIATEYVDGVTLRAHMRAHRIKLHEVLDIGMQISAALDAAHEAKVIHRDIKPENVMLRRRDHIVKVLDFGLAKAVMTVTTDSSSEAGTKPLIHTEPGVLMGTVAYMSPEQSQSESTVDHRTDIWSLGVLLYELIAGRLPFNGKDVHRQVIAIQEMDPPALARFAEGLPVRLEEIVTKALAKDPDERYQTAKDLLIDLRSLKRKLDVDAEIERTVPPEVRGVGSTASGQNAIATAPEAKPTHTSGTMSASSAEYLVNQIRDHKRGLLVSVAVVLVLLLGSFIYFNRKSTATISSIAVLPFANVSNDESAEFLSEGVTESLINSLSQLPNVKVIARSSVFRYKGGTIDPVKAGRELGVQAVLVGRIVQRSDILSINVELVNVEDNTHIWGEQYTRKPSDILTVQSEITRQISDRLRWQLSGQQKDQLAKKQTQNTEAYQLYLRGRYYFYKGTKNAFTTAAEYFKQAIEKDPNYALAYAGLADCYYAFADLKYSPGESIPKMKAAAQRALEIDETLAEAHNSLAIATYIYDWDWPSAEKEFKRALELNPGYVFAHHQYAWFLVLNGRPSEAEKEFIQASELDPLTTFMIADRNVTYVATGDYDRGLEWAQKGEEMDPNHPVPHFVQGWIYAKKGEYEKAIAKLARARQLEDQPWISCWIGYSYAASGDRENAQKIIDELRDLSTRQYVSPYFTAEVYAGLKEKDKTMEYLEKAYDDRSVWLVWLRIEKIFDFLRSDARFQDLQRRVGLPPQT